MSTHSICVACGRFFFRYRNALFPLIMLLLLTITSTHPFFRHNEWFFLWLSAGAALALLGEVVRLGTIGYRYIERGGRQGRVYASLLVQDGVYKHTRNPMYVGNMLIVAGLTMFTGSLPAFLIAVPFFLFVYLCIIKAEEAYLQTAFKTEYQNYCRNVNRIWPKFAGWKKTFSGMQFDWKRALRKDYGTMMVVLLALIWLPYWRHYSFHKPIEAHASFSLRETETILAMLLYLLVRHLKKTNRLSDLHPNPA